MDNKLTRRAVLERGLQLSVGAGLAATLSACGDDPGPSLVCADPGQMTSSEESVRRTLKYTEISPDPARVCASCEFFNAGAGGCGTCEMFGGKAVNPGGHCDSWSVDS